MWLGHSVRTVLLAILGVASSVHAQETDSVEELLDEETDAVQIRDWISDWDIHDIVPPYADLKSWLETEAGLDLVMQNVLMYQRSTGGRRPRDTAVNNFTVFGSWRPLRPHLDGRLVFLYERRDTVSNATVREFSAAVGAGFETNDFSMARRDRSALRQFWWKQPLGDGRLVLALGKLNPSTYYDRNRFAGSTSTGFFSQPFATNPTRRFPGDGLGFNLTFALNDDVEITAGLQDANGNNVRSGFNTIGDGDFFTAAGIRFTPVIDGLGAGNYRLLLWHTDEAELTDDGFGFLASFDQNFGDRVGGFFRYGYSERQVGRLEHLVSTGLVIDDPFGLDHGDRAGVGVAWTRGNRADEGEISTELFYKFQLTANIQFTPNVLVVFDPQNSDKADPVAVFGLRMRFLF